MRPIGVAMLLGCWLAVAPAASAQVRVRVGAPALADYSELHEGLTSPSVEADSVRRLLQANSPAPLWRVVERSLRGRASWAHMLIALTRIAERRDSASAWRARRLRDRLVEEKLRLPKGRDPFALHDALTAINLEFSRTWGHGEPTERADANQLRSMLDAAEQPEELGFGLPEAWLLGRLGAGTGDSLAARFLSAATPERRKFYLTLLGFRRDTVLVPLLARVYATPDSFGLSLRDAPLAADALLWIGNRQSLTALREARERVRTRAAVPAADSLFGSRLAQDSLTIVARTGKPLERWLEELASR